MKNIKVEIEVTELTSVDVTIEPALLYLKF